MIQEGQLSVTGESMCTKYWLLLRRSKPAREKCGRLTDRPDMTLDIYRGRKTTTQQQQLLGSVLEYRCLQISVWKCLYLGCSRSEAGRIGFFSIAVNRCALV